jgi:hypothetical protein
MRESCHGSRADITPQSNWSSTIFRLFANAHVSLNLLKSRPTAFSQAGRTYCGDRSFRPGLDTLEQRMIAEIFEIVEIYAPVGPALEFITECSLNFTREESGN